MSFPRIVNISLYQDSDFSNTILWANPSSTQPLNPAFVNWFVFTSCSAKMQVRASQASNSTQYLALTSGSGLSFVRQQPTGYEAPLVTNGFTITVTNAQTLLIPQGVNFYDLFVIYPNGTQIPFLQGQLIMNPTDTR